jgi:hypothetical protein
MRYFVVMGNTRVGSTWFTSSLNDLPGIFCTREIRWRMPYQSHVPPVHTYIDSSTRSMKERLEVGYKIAGKQDVSAVGAKLKFDPYGYAPPAAFAHLREILEDDVEVVFLRRPYFEIFATWKAYGIRHLANPNYINHSRKKKFIQSKPVKPNRFNETHGKSLERTGILITRGGKVLAPIEVGAHNTSKIVHYSINSAIDDLLVLFYNDILAFEAVRNHPNMQIVHYEDIREQFTSIAQRLSPNDRGDMSAILDNAATRKIETPGERLVFPDAALREISNHLDSLFHELCSGRLGITDLVQCDVENKIITFELPGIHKTFAKHQETRGIEQSGLPGMPSLMRHLSRHPWVVGLMGKAFFPPSQPERVRWVSQRPVYVPAPIAPKPTTWSNSGFNKVATRAAG